MILDQLNHIVRRNYKNAAVLHRFGIDFYKKPCYTLDQACRERQLNVRVIAQALQKEDQSKPVHAVEDLDRLARLGAVQLLDYLKIQHRHFIFRQLPYMQRLISDSEFFVQPSLGFVEILEDLRLAFPLFAEDFARHIFEEEEQMFTYIELLHGVLFGGSAFSSAFVRMEKESVMNFLTQHHAEDDDMSGIRQITHDYQTDPDTPILVKVLYSELQDFEETLTFHARLENQVLLPKALKLESGVKWLFARKSKLN
ncbi:MAG: hemerythrin domain-containing protein [Bernardetiaceae bacterium]